ncbi:phage portal protein [Limnohabitans sp.]|uniref:phage portal protein n=1 Tax=Limnohabitans sp. TaxID=1907725 RepID=UPI00333F1D1E
MSDFLADHRMLELRGIEWNEHASNRTPSGIRVTADNSMACSAYTACIRVISDAVSSLPLHVFERLASGGKAKATSHPVYRLLHMQPNPWQTAQEFRDWMTGMYLHYGASYAEIRPGARGAVSELWPLHSSRMEVERLENGRLRYLYREPSGRQTPYSQEQIFALRFTTEDGIKPIPTYKIFQNVIGLSQALEAHASTFFGNGARPGIVLESDNPIPAEAAERLREQWERMHRGADRAFRTAVLPNGVKAHELSSSNEAAQMLESRAFSVIECCRIFRVPPHMIQSLDRSTYSNIEVQGTEFVQHCLMPHLKRWEAAISRDLIVDDERYFAEHSVSGLLRGDHASRSAYYVSALQNGWMTVNEIRELENLNPIGPEGDKHFIQLNMTTLEKAGEEPPPAPAAEPPVVEDETSPEDDAEDQAEEEDSTDGN